MLGKRLRGFPVSILCFVLVFLASQTADTETTNSLWRNSDQTVTNLISFARLYGVLRWYHPSDEAAQTNWDEVAIYGALNVRDAECSEDLANRLEAFFAPLAPSLRVFPSGHPDPVPTNLAAPQTATRIGTISWQHAGLGTEYSDSLGGIYSSFRSFAPGPPQSDQQDPVQPMLLSLGGGLSAWVSTTLYADGAGTFPRAEVSQAAGYPEISDVDDVTVMLADALVIWNLMEHFYPYYEVVDDNLGDMLERTIHRILTEGSTYTYVDMKTDLLVPLKDGHANIRTSESRGPVAIPDIAVTRIADQIVVTACEGEAASQGIQLGDVISHINGRRAIDVLNDVMAPWSGSPQRRQAIGLLFLLVDLSGTTVELVLNSNDGTSHTVTLARTRPAPLSTRQYEPVEEIEPGVIYVDVSRATASALSVAKHKLASARGAIIDARGYPIDRLWSHILADRPLSSMVLEVPLTSAPNQMDLTMRNLTTSSTASGNLPDEVVFLIDASAFSAGEHQLSYFRRAGIGTFVGQPTTGANGNINILGLPSGARVTWTGMVAQWADGQLFHTVGILPDALVEPTRAGIAAGKDEQCDAALRILKENLAASQSD